MTSVSGINFGAAKPRPRAEYLKGSDSVQTVFEEPDYFASPSTGEPKKHNLLTWQNAKNVALGGLEAYFGVKLAKWAWHNGTEAGLFHKTKAAVFGYLAYKLLTGSVHKVTGHDVSELISSKHFHQYGPQVLNGLGSQFAGLAGVFA